MSSEKTEKVPNSLPRQEAVNTANPVSVLVRRRVFLSVAAVLVAGAYSWFIWPTPYLIVRERDSVFRVKRLSGVREESTTKGWRTKEQLQSEYWAKHAEEQTANQRREAEEKTAQQKKLEQVLSDLKQIKVDVSRKELTRLVIYNPTCWDLGGSYGNTTVEYYSRDVGREVFLVKYETTNNFLKDYTYNDYDLKNSASLDLPDELTSLPAGSPFTQKVFIQFDTATNRDTGERLELKPAFVWKKQRSWTMSPSD